MDMYCTHLKRRRTNDSKRHARSQPAKHVLRPRGFTDDCRRGARWAGFHTPRLPCEKHFARQIVNHLENYDPRFRVWHCFNHKTKNEECQKTGRAVSI